MQTRRPTGRVWTGRILAASPVAGLPQSVADRVVPVRLGDRGVCHNGDMQMGGIEVCNKLFQV